LQLKPRKYSSASNFNFDFVRAGAKEKRKGWKVNSDKDVPE
jgi:hypothetical protein